MIPPTNRSVSSPVPAPVKIHTRYEASKEIRLSENPPSGSSFNVDGRINKWSVDDAGYVFDVLKTPSEFTLLGPSQIKGNNKSYRSLIARKLDATNLYTNQLITEFNTTREYVEEGYFTIFSGGSFRNGCLSHYSRLFSTVNDMGPSAITSDTGASNVAIGKLRGKMNEHQPRVAGIPFLAETVPELRNSFSKLVDVSYNGFQYNMDQLEKAVRKTRNLPVAKKIVTVADIASDLWLALSFSLRPSIADVRDIARTIAEHTSPVAIDVIRFTSSSKTSSQSRASYPGQRVGNWATATKNVVRNLELNYSLVAGQGFNSASSVNYAAVSSFTNDFGIGLQQFIPSAYELMPFSWALDYFVNMGDVLVDTFEMRPKSLIYGCLTRYQVEKVDVLMTYPTAVVYPIQTYIPAHMRYTCVSVKRELMSSIPVRTLWTKNPAGNNALGRLANLTSILTQSMGKRFLSES